MSMHRPTQRAQLFRRITDGPKGHALIRRLGGLQGRRTTVRDAEGTSALKDSYDQKEMGYLDREEISTRDEAKGEGR